MFTQNKELTVGSIMLPLEKFPVVRKDTIMKKALEKMDAFSLGIACIKDSDSQLLGIITDGDIRRKLLSAQRPLAAFFIDDAINQSIDNPITASSNMSLFDAVDLMEEKQVWDLPVVDGGKLVGLLHLHSAIKLLLED
jgi:DeoR family transcriptional regulator, catabolite repression regulator